MRLLARASLVTVLAVLGFGLASGQARWPAACAGAAVGFVALALEFASQRGSSRQVAGAVVGLLAGLLAALLAGTLVIGHLPVSAQAAVAAMLVVTCAWLGASLGAAHGIHVPAGSAARGAGVDASAKIIDTSVIIDGRIVDVIGAGFLEGTLIIPQFVLRELQQVADSSDALKRNRGRKGLDVLKSIQVSDKVKVEISAEDTPEIREVDGKLLWLAERRGAQVLTNDYNLNKVAQLRGIRVLNVNDLANAMKPVVLPGEMLNVQVIKEGKERNQGVGYLDDGTMVVVESGRRLIGQKVDVVVTSVIQTNAGKMIFGSLEDEIEPRTATRVVRRSSESDVAVLTSPAVSSSPTVGEG